MRTKLKEEPTRLKTLKSMLEYHKENSSKKMLIAKLEKEINFIEVQEEAKERELKLAMKAQLEALVVKKSKIKTASYKVETETKKPIFYGSLRECSLFLGTYKDADLVIKRNTP